MKRSCSQKKNNCLPFIPFLARRLWKDAGVFNKLNPAILIIQDDTVLRKLVNTSFLMEEELSLKQALYDYYVAKKFQLLKIDYLKETENEDINEMVECILQRLAGI